MDFELLDFRAGVGIGHQRLKLLDKAHFIQSLDPEKHYDAIAKQHGDATFGIRLDGQRRSGEAIDNFESPEIKPVTEQEGAGCKVLPGLKG